MFLHIYPLLAELDIGEVFIALIVLGTIVSLIKWLYEYARDNPRKFKQKVVVILVTISRGATYPIRVYQRHAEEKARQEEVEKETLRKAECKRRQREEEERQRELDRLRKQKEDSERKRQEEEERKTKAEQDRRQRQKEENDRRARAEEERRQRQQEEEDRKAKAAEEERHRQKYAEYVATVRPIWESRPKLARCASEASHFFPTVICGPCPLCGARERLEVEGYSGWTEEEFLESFPQELLPPIAKDSAMKEEVSAIEQELDKRLRIRDFPGIGNRILELLLLPAQERKPRESGLLVAQRINGIVAAKFGLHEATTYMRPLRDELLSFSSRNEWAEEIFHQLMIFAHLLESTWKLFPPPYDKLRPFYVALAKRQQEIIGALVANRAGIDRVLNSRYPDALKNRVSPIPLKPITEDDE